MSCGLKKPSSQLTSLNLSENEIGDEGAEALAGALQDPNRDLTSLDLSGYRIRQTGTWALATTVVEMQSEREIIITWLGDTWPDTLARAEEALMGSSIIVSPAPT